MLKKTLIAGLGISALLSGLAQAEGYYGGNLSFYDYNEVGLSDSASLTGIVGRLGTTFNENFSAEVRAGFGVGDDTVSAFGLNADVELDNMLGAYVRGGIPVSDSFYPYAVIGYTRIKLTASIPGFGSESESDSDLSFGLGADINITENVIFNIEYMNYFDKDGAEIDGYSIGVATKF